MDRRIVMVLAVLWLVVAAIDIYLHGFTIVDQFFGAFRPEVRVLP